MHESQLPQTHAHLSLPPPPRERTHPGPQPSVYVVLRVIGCRQHWLAVTGGWAPAITQWTQNWLSSDREVAYQAARCAGGLLVRMSREEWAAHLDAAAAEAYADKPAPEEELS